jgi:hypothetical protein
MRVRLLTIPLKVVCVLVVLVVPVPVVVQSRKTPVGPTPAHILAKHNPGNHRRKYAHKVQQQGTRRCRRRAEAEHQQRRSRDAACCDCAKEPGYLDGLKPAFVFRATESH